MPVVVDVQGLHKEYGPTVAVDDVTLQVREGEIFGILGPNGAGKTTTVECIEGLRTADRGEISVLGLHPRRDRARLTEVLGVQLQDSALPDRLRVAEALQLYSSFYRQPADWRELLDGLGLAEKRDTPFAKLSGGQRQRLSIALALVGNPRIAVLDELTTGLDPQARRDTWALISGIRDRGVTVLLVTHFMEEAERLCDRVAVIGTGRVIATGSPAELTARAGEDQVIRFRPSAAVDEAALLTLPEVTGLFWHGEQLEVTGRGDVLGAVISQLARRGIIARQLRVEQTSLEDAFVALTAHNGH
jgi:ABC-2 type transport system ATP-binding protein